MAADFFEVVALTGAAGTVRLMTQATSITSRWRLLSLAATMALILVAAVRGGPSDAVVALVFVTPCMLGWLAVADSPQRGAKVAAILVTAFAVFYAWSQLRPGVIAPPLVEWAVACVVIGSAIVITAMRHQYTHPSGSTEVLLYPGQPPRMPPRPALAKVAVAFPVVLAMCCVPASWLLRDASEAGVLEAQADTKEALPLPAHVRLVQVDCVGGGSHFLCEMVWTVAATDGASREQLIERLVQHYRQRDWPLARDRYRYYGCRPMQGIMTWEPLCLRLDFDPETEGWVDRPEIPNTVNVYIG